MWGGCLTLKTGRRRCSEVVLRSGKAAAGCAGSSCVQERLPTVAAARPEFRKGRRRLRRVVLRSGKVAAGCSGWSCVQERPPKVAAGRPAFRKVRQRLQGVVMLSSRASVGWGLCIRLSNGGYGLERCSGKIDRPFVGYLRAKI